MTTTNTRRCHICGTITTGYCRTCLAQFPHRPHPDGMTGEQRAAEMEQLGGPLEIPFNLVHQRIEELVGRSVWTHEMAGEERWAMLVEEARTWHHPGVAEVIAKLPDDLPAIVVDVSGE